MAQTISHTGPLIRSESPGRRTARMRLAGLVVIALMAVSGGLIGQFQASNAKQAALQMHSNGPFSLYPH